MISTSRSVNFSNLCRTFHKLRALRPEVATAVPRMNLAFPAAGRGDFEGSDLKFEVGGFSDGVDGSFVQVRPETGEILGEAPAGTLSDTEDAPNDLSPDGSLLATSDAEARLMT